MCDDAGAPASQFVGNALEDVDYPAVIAQKMCGEQAAQRAADDYCPPLARHGEGGADSPAIARATIRRPAARVCWRHCSDRGQNTSTRRCFAASTAASPGSHQWCAWFSASKPDSTWKTLYVPNSGARNM